MNWKRSFLIAAGIGVVAIVALGAARMSDQKLPAAPASSAALIEEGRYLAIAGDCAACHTRAGGPAMAGGFPLQTPFGVIYSPNLTPDKETGIGDWSRADFVRAMREGLGPHRGNLYPAFPYPYYARVTVKDLDAIYAYLMSQPAFSYEAPKNEMDFPYNIRLAVTGWNWLFFRSKAFEPDPAQSAEWNRGAYLFDGLGHCAACHSPRNALGAEKTGQKAQGGLIDTWWAPDLTGSLRTGLGGWTKEEIAQFLKTGVNAHTQVYGSMTEVIQNSTSLMTDADLAAMATYIKSLPAAKTAAPAKVDSALVAAGQPVYFANCALCHGLDGKGLPGLYPGVAGNSGVQAPNPTSVLHIILAGNKKGPEVTIKGIDSMPAFGDKLSDKDIAAVATYVRNSFGNAAPAITAQEVTDLRAELGKRKVAEVVPAPPAAAPAAPPAAPAVPPAAQEPMQTGPAKAG
jgi:mono/diheme cytochrome c family protein